MHCFLPKVHLIYGLLDLKQSINQSINVFSLQVGPSATRAFDDFLHRLLCKSVDLNGQNLKELLLKIVYQLTADK